MATKDVELIIRARDEATKTVNSIVAALSDLKAAQSGVAASAGKTGGLLGQLANEYGNLERQVQGLQSLGKVAQQMDRASAAVDRLDLSVQRATAEQGKLEAAQLRAAQASATASRALEASKAALDAQKASLAFLGERVSKTSIAYKEQAQAVATAKTAYNEAKVAANAAATEQRKVAGAVAESAASLDHQRAALAGARAEYQQITASAAQASTALGGVTASQEAVSAASKQAAADLDKVGQALVRQRSSQPAPATTVAAGPAAAATAAYREQVAAVQAAGEAYNLARTQASNLGREIASTVTPNRELQTAFLLARDASQSAKVAYVEQAAALNQLKGASRGSFAVFESLANGIHALPDSVGRVGAAVKQTTQAVVTSNKVAGRKGEVLFGLRPYELQNLSFQINDLITQIASGTSPSQAFAQQFGQIVQIFPRLGAVLIPILPELAGLAVVLGTVAASMAQVADQEASVRKFSGALAASADGSRHSAEAMAKAAHELDVYGTSLKNARAEVQIFTAAGIDDSQLERFGRTAENATTIMGIKVPDAAKKMTDAFTQGFQSVDDLDKSLNFLTASERLHVQELFNSGRAAEGRTEAFRIFEQRMDDGAAKTRGPWTEAIRNLTQAWDNFLHFLSDTAVIRAAITILGKLAQAARDATAALPGVNSGGSTGGANPAIDREVNQLRQLQAERQRAAKGLDAGGIARDAVGNAARTLLPGGLGNLLPHGQSNRSTAQIDRDIANTQARLDKLRKDSGDIVTDGSNAQQKAGQRVLKDLNDQFTSLKGINDQKRIQIAGEKAYQKALEAGADQASANKAKLLGENIERFSVNKERAAEAKAAEARQRAADSRAKALQNKLHSMEGRLAGADNTLAGKVAEGQVASLQSRLDVISKAAEKIRGEVETFKKTGGTNISGESLAAFQARVDANTKILQQQATLKFYAESIGELEKQRDERLKSIADRFADGKITAADAFKQEAQANADLQAQIAATAATAEDFAKSIRGATPDPKLEAFIDKMGRLRTAPATGTKSPAAKGGGDLLTTQERQLNDLIGERNAIVQTNNELLQQGVITLEQWRQRVQGAYADSTPEIFRQINAIKQLLELLKEQGAITGATYDAWMAQMDLAASKTKDLTTQILTEHDANMMLADAGVSFFDRFAQSVGQGANAVQAFGQAFLSTVADILLEIGKLILKQELLNLVMKSGLGQKLAGGVNGLFSGAASAAPLITAAGALTGAGGAIASSAGPLMVAAGQLQSAAFALAATKTVDSMAGLFHEGGIAGSANRTRMVNPAIFAGARRYHLGGIAGLAPGEIPTILKRGEVIDPGDGSIFQRMFGGGPSAPGAPPQPMAIRNVLLMDPSQVEAALAAPGGEKVILSVLSKNAATVKSIINS